VPNRLIKMNALRMLDERDALAIDHPLSFGPTR